MGRIAASIGGAFGAGISGGISQRRREDAQRKRDERLEGAVMERVRQAHLNSLAQQANADAIRDQNLLQEQIRQDKANRAMAESLGFSLSKNEGLITNDIFAPSMRVKTELLKVEQRNKAAALKVQEEKDVRDTNIKLIDFFRGAKEKDSPGGETITSGEKGQAATEIGGTAKQLQSALNFIEGKPEGKSALEKDLDIELKVLSKVLSNFTSTAKQKEAAFQRFSDLRRKVRIEKGLIEEEEILTPLEDLNLAVESTAKAHNVSDEEAFQMLLNSMDRAAQKATLQLAAGSTFFPVEEVEDPAKVFAKTGFQRQGEQIKKLARGTVSGVTSFFTPDISGSLKRIESKKSEKSIEIARRATLTDEQIADEIITGRGSITTSGFSLGGLAPPTSKLGRTKRSNFLKSNKFGRAKKTFLEGN